MPYVEEQQEERAGAWADAIALLRSNGTAGQVLNIVIHEATWYVPLQKKQPSFADLRYWSQGTRDAGGVGGLKREHVTTRAEAKRSLDGARDRDAIKNVLNAMVVCVVTDDEHNRLDRFKHLAGWDRYRAAAVRVYDRKESRWLW